IDPARNIAKAANARGIPTIATFFNLKTAGELVRKKHLEADLIYGANVFAHVPEIRDFVHGVDILLKPVGTALFEFPYLGGLFENKFDTIYHEHVFYFSLLALIRLFRDAGLEVYDSEFVSMQGGSLRIYVAHQGAFPVSGAVHRLKEREIKAGYDRVETYEAIKKHVSALKKDLIQTLALLKNEGASIAAYGAPAKGIILLNYFRIRKYLDFIVDKSEAKQGLYIPGVHMKIEDPDLIRRKRPDYLLILPWNISEEIRSQLRWYRKSGGRFILPVPAVKIL
ncbi:class I SAM-dependent methyltransferase, partial [Patescibacteria group bacterium]|nr:class I SAM-dependent methyltransferase [Patescibacteria group bacterium]